MDENSFDLRQFREDRLHLTQKELAGLLDIRQDSISRMEQNPDQISVAMLVKLARLAGQSLDEVANYQPVQPPGLNVRRTWATVQYRCADIQQRLQQEYGEPDSLLDPFCKDAVNGLKKLVTTLSNNKPVLAVAGAFSSGKSTFVNSLLGQRLLPVSYAMSTLRLLHIRHIDDRPEGTVNTVFLYRANAGDSDGENQMLMEGGPELLQSSGGNSEVGKIEVYADSPILRNCDIVRLPSPDFEGSADPASISASPDILVYLNSSVQSPSASDASYFRLLLERTRVLEREDRPEYGCLSNLFLVCAKAHLLGDPDRARNIARKEIGSTLYNTLPPSFWEDREALTGAFCTEDLFLSRCFIYAVQDDPSWRTQLENSLRATIERMPDAIWGDISQRIVHYRDALCQELDKRINQPASELPEAGSSRKDRWDSERQEAVIQKRYWIMDDIGRCEQESVNRILEIGRKLTEEVFLGGMLKELGKDHIQQLTAYLQDNIEKKAEEILRTESRKIMTDVEEYLSLLDTPEANDAFWNAMPEPGSRGAFLPGIAGGQQLPAKVNTDLQEENQWTVYSVEESKPLLPAALGAAAVTALSAALAPAAVVPGILAGSILGTAGILGITSRIFSGASAPLTVASTLSEAVNAAGTTTSDKKKIKSIQEVFRGKVIPVYERSIRRFWRDTQEAFECAAQSAQEARDKALQSDVPEVSISPEQRIKEASGLKDFFESLPL